MFEERLGVGTRFVNTCDLGAATLAYDEYWYDLTSLNLDAVTWVFWTVQIDQIIPHEQEWYDMYPFRNLP